MNAIAWAMLSFAVAADPIELPSDVNEIDRRAFEMPLQCARANEVQQVRAFVSKNRGKTWSFYQDYQVTDKSIRYTAANDGEYWFALQIQSKSGEWDPDSPQKLNPVMKVYVNSKHKVLKTEMSVEELRVEVKNLHQTVKQLQAEIRQLQAAQTRKSP